MALYLECPRNSAADLFLFTGDSFIFLSLQDPRQKHKVKISAINSKGLGHFILELNYRYH